MSFFIITINFLFFFIVFVTVNKQNIKTRKHKLLNNLLSFFFNKNVY